MLITLFAGRIVVYHKIGIHISHRQFSNSYPRTKVHEVDNMHNQIENAMQVTEFYSPIFFKRVLLKVNQNKPYRVKQMSKSDLRTI